MFADQELLDQYEKSGRNVLAASKVLGLAKSQYHRRIKRILSAAAPAAAPATVTAPVDPWNILSAAIPRGPVPGFAPRTWHQDLDYYYSNKSCLFLLGESGTGKTAAVQQFAYDKSLPFIQISCEFGLSLKELIGFRSARARAGGTEIFFQTGKLVPFLQSASVVLFDEINLLSPQAQAPLYKLLNDRRIDNPQGDIEVVLSPECWIVCTGNYPLSRYTGVNKLNPAITNRLAGVIITEPFDCLELKAILRDRISDSRLTELINFYLGFSRIAAQGRFDSVLSIRNLIAYCSMLNTCGETDISKVVNQTLLYPILLSAKRDEFCTMQQLALTTFNGYSI